MGEVDVKELDGRMVPLSSASEDLEISASNAGPALGPSNVLYYLELGKCIHLLPPIRVSFAAGSGFLPAGND